jgi:hypothetical protein
MAPKGERSSIEHLPKAYFESHDSQAAKSQHPLSKCGRQQGPGPLPADDGADSTPDHWNHDTQRISRGPNHAPGAGGELAAQHPRAAAAAVRMAT